ncbi:MAG: oligosaccharide flippase family protein [Chthoniobacterales bacterium]
MKTTADPLPFPLQRMGEPTQSEKTGRELKRAALLNAIAMVASNFRAIFTLLIARLLGPIALGIFSVAWATADLISKIGICGLDDAVTTFVGRAEAVGDRDRSRIYFRIGSLIAVIQSAMVAAVLSFAMPHIGAALGLDRQLASALAIIVWALPGIALYRISTSVSRGLKVMQHDIYSRGLTEPAVTTIAFLVAMPLGAGAFAPEAAAIVGSSASGLMALLLAAGLFQDRSHLSLGSMKNEAKSLVRYALPIGGDQFLNAFIWRVDVIILGFLVGRAPGVTLTTLGIYGAVAGLANGLRRVSQPFTPIFAPVVAGMTSIGAHAEAAKTYSRLLQWMLWILLPATAVMILAGGTIMTVYGKGFETGAQWLAIVAIACAINAFVNLGETVIMVQRPGLNLINSIVTCIAGSTATFLFISQLGVLGAALGILTTYSIQGLFRTIILRVLFRWPSPWADVRPVVIVSLVGIVPAVVCRSLFPGIIGQLSAATICIAVFAAGWFYHQRSHPAG